MEIEKDKFIEIDRKGNTGTFVYVPSNYPGPIALDAKPYQPERLSPEDSNIHSEFGCSFPVSFNTSEGKKTIYPGKRYDENLNEIE